MTAKEMFEELGYACDLSCDCVRYSMYIGDNLYQIDINFRYKTIEKRQYTTIFSDSEVSEITFEELQAINKQIEELGWLNE